MPKSLLGGVSFLIIELLIQCHGLPAVYAQLPTSYAADSIPNQAQSIDSMAAPFNESRSKVPLSTVVSLQGADESQETEIAPADYLHISYRDITAPGISRHKARALVVSVRNTQAIPLEIMQAEVVNGMDEEVTVADGKLNRENLGQEARNFLMRGSNMVSGFGVIGANNYAASSAMAPTPTMYANSQSAGEKETVEKPVTKQFLNQFRGINLSPNQTYSFKTLVPSGANPQFKMAFRNIKTNRVLQFSSN